MVIDFVKSPIFKFIISFFIISFNRDSLIHPIFPPNLAESEMLCILAALLNPNSKILFSIDLFFFEVFRNFQR